MLGFEPRTLVLEAKMIAISPHLYVTSTEFFDTVSNFLMDVFFYMNYTLNEDHNNDITRCRRKFFYVKLFYMFYDLLLFLSFLFSFFFSLT